MAATLTAAGMLFLGAGDAQAAKARAVLQPKSGSQVSGEVTFEEGRGGVLVRVSARGVAPGTHGLHVHGPPTRCWWARSS
ncbi:MAG: superoxide dismutase family protein [Candidatus Tectomicrobia bacterium]|nr:superoxide dismutase family protein [Candidatus Tectomicrobia bacterium]